MFVQNVSLLFSAVPELEALAKTVWTDGIIAESSDSLGTAESRVRFENLLTDILIELSLTKMVVFVSYAKPFKYAFADLYSSSWMTCITRMFLV
jgi:hypothetical protein